MNNIGYSNLVRDEVDYTHSAIGEKEGERTIHKDQPERANKDYTDMSSQNNTTSTFAYSNALVANAPVASTNPPSNIMENKPKIFTSSPMLKTHTTRHVSTSDMYNISKGTNAPVDICIPSSSSEYNSFSHETSERIESKQTETTQYYPPQQYFSPVGDKQKGNISTSSPLITQSPITNDLDIQAGPCRPTPGLGGNSSSPMKASQSSNISNDEQSNAVNSSSNGVSNVPNHTLVLKLLGEEGVGMDFPSNNRDGGDEEDMDDTEVDEQDDQAMRPERKATKRASGPILIGPDGQKLRRRKGKRNSDKPKRPLPPFMFYSLAKRKEFAKSRPNTSLMEITQSISESWSKISASQKKVYINMSIKDKARYQGEMGLYKKNETFPCGYCEVHVQDGDKAIYCDYGCQKWFHLKCSGLTDEAYLLVANEPMASWMCNDCFAERKIQRKRNLSIVKPVIRPQCIIGDGN